MSSLARVTVVSVDGPRVVCTYAATHPDALQPPDHEIYPFQIIVESFENMRNGRLHTQAGPFPLSRNQQKTIVQCHPRKSDVEEMCTLIRGKEVEVTQEEYERLSVCREEGIGVIGKKNGTWFKVYEPDRVLLMAETTRTIVDFHLEKTVSFDVEEEERCRRFAAGVIPKCEIHFAVKDADLIYHVVPASEWDTAMCRYPV